MDERKGLEVEEGQYSHLGQNLNGVRPSLKPRELSQRIMKIRE